jgi:hypothetical protein
LESPKPKKYLKKTISKAAMAGNSLKKKGCRVNPI